MYSCMYMCVSISVSKFKLSPSSDDLYGDSTMFILANEEMRTRLKEFSSQILTRKHGIYN